jgi:hypothetical protein
MDDDRRRCLIEQEGTEGTEVLDLCWLCLLLLSPGLAWKDSDFPVATFLAHSVASRDSGTTRERPFAPGVYLVYLVSPKHVVGGKAGPMNQGVF